MSAPTTAVYGPVLIVSGRHAGKFGVYDDDDEDDRGRERAVVYLKRLWLDPYVLVNPAALVPLDGFAAQAVYERAMPREVTP